jgi:hypothetical protein
VKDRGASMLLCSFARPLICSSAFCMSRGSLHRLLREFQIAMPVISFAFLFGFCFNVRDESREYEINIE